MADFDLQASLEDRHHQYHLGMVKTAADIDRYEHVIATLRPSLIVETGTWSGKSALWFAQHAAVVTCDPDPHIDPGTAAVIFRQAHPVRLVTDLSTSSAFAQAVLEERTNHPGPVLLTLDSDHSKANVLAELDRFAPAASYIVVEDTLLRWFPDDERVYDGDPLDAVEEWLPQHPEWMWDEEVERMHPVTQMPGGWLVREGTL